MRKAEWREVQAVSVTITRDSSAEKITGRAKVRTNDKNAIAGLLERKGKADRTESPCLCGLFGGDVDQLNGKNREDDDKRTHTREELTAQAIESAKADGVFHLEN